MARKRLPLLFILLFIIFVLLVLLWTIFKQDETASQLDSTKHKVQTMELSFFIPTPIDTKLPPFNDDFIRQTIEEKFNVTMDITYKLPGYDYTNAIESLLLSNNPPDMWIDMSNDKASKFALNGVLADMTPYISPLTMPNYFKYWTNEKEIKQFHIHNKFYRLPLPYDKNSYRSYYIREDWLTKLGLEIPRSYSEYLNVLHAFTFNDPDGNHLEDTYGFSTSGNGSSISTDWPEYAKNELFYPAYMSNKKLIDMESDLNIEHVVNDILHVIQLGVVDPDWFLNQGTEHIYKAVHGKVGIVLGQTADFALDANPTSIQTLSRAIDPEANWLPFNPLGNVPLSAGISPDIPFVFSKLMADTQPQKVKKIVEILDWLASEEGYLLTHYGIENKHYTRSGNMITPLPLTPDEIIRNDFMKIWSFFTPDTPSVLGLQVINPNFTERDKEIKQFLATLPVIPKVGVALAPPIGIDVAAFRAKQNELQIKMMFFDQSGQNWPDYYQEIMDQYNGDKIIKNFEQQVIAANKEN